MKKQYKKMGGAVLLGMSAMLLAGCKDSGNSDPDTISVSYWIPKGEDSSYYEEYEENPVIQYIEDNYEFNGKKLDIDFYSAPPGSEADNFNTLLGTGDYSDILDMTMASQTATELYEDELIWDLTDYIEEYMPNYQAYLDANPDCEERIYTIVDGEKKILTLMGFADGVTPNFEGFCYRRDWVAKYGKNPQTGEAFTYGFEDENNDETWFDNVVFPSGGENPVYISDWEWMFEIFEEAMDDLGIDDGYCYSCYYQGFMQTGDLYTGFGGGAPYWYKDGDTIVDGCSNDNFRAYLECLNNWYEKGWLDKAFAEHTQDMFYAVDSQNVYQGKVGLWQGRISTVGTQIDAGDEYTSGAVVYGCSQPINDIYGSDEQKNQTPDYLYQNSKYGNSVVLTTKLDEEEMIAFLEFTDFLFTEEGSELATFGLDAEQYEESGGNDLYESLGLTNGSYYVDENGKYVTYLSQSSDTYAAVSLTRVNAKLSRVENLSYDYDRYSAEAVELWDLYESTAGLNSAELGAVSVDGQNRITQIRANSDSFLIRTVPTIINGTGYDVKDDASWEQYLKDYAKYGTDEATQIYQEAYDLLLGD